ncbi:hypothetical protein QQS21_002935 [Conoideocrella luteorostrata]|uniref:Uncharacterized protein n=1 Tax=Conoideocrella luteorostrata TaxID=1105319 RepID=A0AAJ0CX62_9HYPO|nr:hypothetical protein QQS21_002935 [Conoideocrella luteorostrata]
MPPNTSRRRLRTYNEAKAANPTHRLEESKQTFLSLSLTKGSQPRIREVWQELRRAHEACLCSGDRLQEFPYWALDNLDHEQMAGALTLGYLENLGELRSYGASVSKGFGVEPWKFLLFFGRMEQKRARTLNKITAARPDLEFEQLYREVKQNRSKRLKSGKKTKEFMPADFQQCMPESTSEIQSHEHEQEVNWSASDGVSEDDQYGDSSRGCDAQESYAMNRGPSRNSSENSNAVSGYPNDGAACPAPSDSSTYEPDTPITIEDETYSENASVIVTTGGAQEREADSHEEPTKLLEVYFRIRNVNCPDPKFEDKLTILHEFHKIEEKIKNAMNTITTINDQRTRKESLLTSLRKGKHSPETRSKRKQALKDLKNLDKKRYAVENNLMEAEGKRSKMKIDFENLHQSR